jgi:hypothetical protein
MAKAIFEVLFRVIVSLTNVFLAPINALLVNFFPDTSNLINTFNNNITLYIGNNLAYFSSMLPPTTRGLIIFYLTFLISYYTISFSIHGILKIVRIIKAVKIW